MKGYKHFIIIRFNIRANFGCKLKDPEKNPMERILDESYLDERFNLFETYTLASLKKQTCQNFQTIVLFHKDTPERFKKKIEQMRKEFRFESVFLGDQEKFSFEKFVEKKYGAQYNYFITSRLDNDDMYAETYIEKIQEYVDNQYEKRTYILSFCRGEKFDLYERKRYQFDYMQNHFLSMLGPSNVNIMQHDHSTIESSGYEMVILEPNKVMWTELVHDSNVANTIQSYVRYQHAILQLEHWNVQEKKMRSSSVAVYGVGEVGKAVYSRIKDKFKIICFIDEYTDMREYDGVPILRIAELLQIQEDYGIIIAVSYDFEIIKKNLVMQLGNQMEIKSIEELAN